MKVLMVCLGNICRSPMAEGILQSLVQQASLDWHVDSAGTGSWHVGERPDARAIATCAKHSIDIRGQRARQFQHSDLDNFDLILTMDEQNHSDVMSMVRSEHHRGKVRQITSFSDSVYRRVPDPYFDGSFDEVFYLLYDACLRIVERKGETGESG